MKLKSFLISLLAFAFVLGAVGTQAADAGIDPYLAAGAVTTLVILAKINQPTTHLFHMHGIDVAIWADYIVEEFFRINKFMDHAFSDDGKVEKGKYVIIPQAGEQPNVVKNRSVFPAQVHRRADSTVMYPLEWYTTDPEHITSADENEISYDKMNSVMGGHVKKLGQSVADDLLINWLTDVPDSNIIQTTGPNAIKMLAGLTGLRKSFVVDQLQDAALILDAADNPDEDRYALLSAFAYHELTKSLSINEQRDFSSYFDAKTGVVGQLFGINIMKRSMVSRFTLDGSDLVVKPWGSAAEATDRDVSLVWQKDAVARAKGQVKMYENIDDATQFGDVYSAEMFMGGRRRRADNKGVVAIVQALGS